MDKQETLNKILKETNKIEEEIIKLENRTKAIQQTITKMIEKEVKKLI